MSKDVCSLGYSAAELSALFSNLTKGCEKQYLPELAGLYRQLASYYESKRQGASEGGFPGIQEMVHRDLDSHFPLANEAAGRKQDRGALRALKWCGQVSRMIQSHLKRIESGTPGFIENTNVYVCEICGFIYVGDEKPEICPVCKVPGMKMTLVKRGA